MPDIVIRRVEPRDLPALIELMTEHAAYERAPFDPPSAHALSAALFAEPVRLFGWLVDMGQQPVGYASASREISTWRAAEFLHLDCLFVRAAARNGGAGKSLLQAAVEEARRQQIEHLEWQTPAWNEDAIRFYHRQGATQANKVRFRLQVRNHP